MIHFNCLNMMLKHHCLLVLTNKINMKRNQRKKIHFCCCLLEYHRETNPVCSSRASTCEAKLDEVCRYENRNADLWVDNTVLKHREHDRRSSLFLSKCVKGYTVQVNTEECIASYLSILGGCVSWFWLWFRFVILKSTLGNNTYDSVDVVRNAGVAVSVWGH